MITLFYKDIMGVLHTYGVTDIETFIANTDLTTLVNAGTEIDVELNKIQATVFEIDYMTARQLAYPIMQEQLDMQYWDSVNGTNIWKETIQGIKEDYPKP